MSCAHLAKLRKFVKSLNFVSEVYTFLSVVDMLDCVAETSRSPTKARQLIEEIDLDRDSLTPTQARKIV